ncbi:MAG TPA: hypothetical protein VGV14_19075, partial [Rhodanobacter sp.]|nr:hypothetical protein [Rhodanobacter sp.]
GDTSVPDTSAQVLACYADGRERGKAAYLAYRAQLKTDMLRADASAVYAAWIATLGEPQALNGASTPQDLVLEQAAATLEADSTE